MNIPLLDLKKQYEEIKNQIEPAVISCMESGVYIQGEQVNKFENEFANYLNVKHAISTGNGTDALVIALKAAGINRGDEVITTPFTYFATAEAIASLGAVPVFADIDEKTFNIDPKSIEKKITSKTKCIIPVHIFGLSAQMDEINRIAENYNLTVIEDACQASGAEYKGRKVGTFGSLACFSFFPTKNLGCFGDGGLITTNDDRLNVICRALRNHGSGKNGAAARDYLNNIEPKTEQDDNVDSLYNPYKYYNYLIGCNSRLDSLQAAILRIKLEYLDQWNEKRVRNARRYCEKINNSSVILPSSDETVKHIYHQFALRHPKKDELISYLAQKGITAGVFYPVPLHLQKVFEYLGYKPGDLPVAEKITSESVCLPIYPELTDAEIDYTAECINSFK